MLGTKTTPTQAPPRRVPGARMGWIRAPRVPAPERGPWMGDVSHALWYDNPEIPAWINGEVRSLPYRIGVVIGVLLFLNLVKLVMVLAV